MISRPVPGNLAETHRKPESIAKMTKQFHRTETCPRFITFLRCLYATSKTMWSHCYLLSAPKQSKYVQIRPSMYVPIHTTHHTLNARRPLCPPLDTNTCRSRHPTQFYKLWNARRSTDQHAKTLSLTGGFDGKVGAERGRKNRFAVILVRQFERPPFVSSPLWVQC